MKKLMFKKIMIMIPDGETLRCTVCLSVKKGVRNVDKQRRYFFKS